jgi:hypothetical protein
MAHRWFTVLKNGGSFHGELLNNPMVEQKTWKTWFVVLKMPPQTL